MSTGLYERDFYAWTNEQAALLRLGKWRKIDIEHIAEEIESMGRSEKRELLSRLTVLLQHLLKWEYQAQRRCISWRVTVTTQRVEIPRHLAENPSLMAQTNDYIVLAYEDARALAATETGLSRKIFPAMCPYTYEQMMDLDFWPGEPSISLNEAT
jgi:hypothetical protein